MSFLAEAERSVVVDVCVRVSDAWVDGWVMHGCAHAVHLLVCVLCTRYECACLHIFVHLSAQLHGIADEVVQVCL